MRKYKPTFKSPAELYTLVEDYFKYIEGEYRVEEKAAKKGEDGTSAQKAVVRDAEPATISGLVFHLGFNSREEFEAFEKKGKYAAILNRARLRVEAVYEKKLHQASPTGAMFVLKNMGWNEKPHTEKLAGTLPKNLTIKVIETGFKPASNEKDVTL